MSEALEICIISDATTWMNAYIAPLLAQMRALGHEATWVHDPMAIPHGDLLLCLSCTVLIPPPILARNKNNLVIHQSALPKGRGWSPLSWQVLEGATTIPVTLCEAAERVDRGAIYLRDEIPLVGTELVEELRAAQAAASFRLALQFLAEYPDVLTRGETQDESQATFYPRRRADANRLDPDKTLREQFNLLRIADNERYPAYFELGGETFILKIEKKPNPTPLPGAAELPAVEPARSGG